MTWTPYREPLYRTLLRTVGIAVVLGGAIAWAAHRLDGWPIASLLVLWISLGGHFVELWFLNWLRPRISSRRAWQVAVRLALWLVGGTGLGLGIAFTARAFGVARAVPWWQTGPILIAVELVAHGALALRRRPNFYDGRG
jgi:hypothetical protein